MSPHVQFSAWLECGFSRIHSQVEYGKYRNLNLSFPSDYNFKYGRNGTIQTSTKATAYGITRMDTHTQQPRGVST